MRTDDLPLRLTLVAPNGRMGRAIAAAVAEDSDYRIDQDLGDVLVDFSAPEALAATLERARTAAVPVLIGTTGLDDLAEQQLKAAAEHVAVLRAANTSLGVALLSELVERAARALDQRWDIEVLEMHHRAKADAPSGTALALGESARRGRDGQGGFVRSREGTGLSRTASDIGFAALRGGTVAGDHDVMFLGPEERVILSHRAENRMIFARGAMAACRFLHRASPGLYSMRDVIGAS